MLLEPILVAALLIGLVLIVAGRVQILARKRRAQEKAHVLKRVADLEEQRR